MLLSDVGVNLLVVPAGVFLLSFSKWYVVGDAAISGVSLRILLSHVERNTNRERRYTARPIKLDASCANILLGFLDRIIRIPSGIRRDAKPGSERQGKNAQDFHVTYHMIRFFEQKRGF